MKTIVQISKDAKETASVNVKVDKSLNGRKYAPSKKLEKANKLVAGLSVK